MDRCKPNCHGGAAETNDLATVQTMLSAALDPNTSCLGRRYRGWEKPLHVALRHQHQSMIQLLLEAYADVTADSQPLMLATINGDIDITRLLVARGASVNAENPLAEAANRGHVDVVRYLLEAGADMNSYVMRTTLTHHYCMQLLNAVPKL